MFSVAGPVISWAPVQSAEAYHFMLYTAAVAGFARARRRVAVVFMIVSEAERRREAEHEVSSHARVCGTTTSMTRATGRREQKARPGGER